MVVVARSEEKEEETRSRQCGTTEGEEMGESPVVKVVVQQASVSLMFQVTGHISCPTTLNLRWPRNGPMQWTVLLDSTTQETLPLGRDAWDGQMLEDKFLQGFLVGKTREKAKIER